MTLLTGSELGATTDKTALIIGNPETVDSVATQYADQVTKIDTRHAALKAVRIPSWVGPASDAWETRMHQELAQWIAFSDALETASKAFTSYASALRHGQGKAQEAIDKWTEGDNATTASLATHNASVDSYNDAVSAGSPNLPPMPGPFDDPGDALRKEAQEILDDAREAVDDAGLAATKELGGLPGSKTSSESEWFGAEGDVEGPKVRWDWWDKKFGDDKSGDYKDDHGDSDFLISLGKASGDAWVYRTKGRWEDYLLGGKATADGEFRVLSADGSAEAVMDKNGVRLNADGTLTLVGANGSSKHEWKRGGYEVNGAASVEATADGHANVDKNGGHVGGEVFAGGRAEVDGGLELLGIKLTGGAEGWAGAGAAADGLVGYEDGTFKLKGAGGLAWGLGGKLDGGIEVDVVEVYGSLKDGAGAVASLLD